MLSQRNHFAKQFTKTASALPVELFVELKLKKNDFTSEVKPYQTRPNLVYVPAMFFNGTSMEEYGTNTYNVSWDAPAKGITIFSYYNTFFFLGCDFDVDLFDSVRNPIGSCMSRCHDKVLPNQGPCFAVGCCSIILQNDISGFLGTIVRADNMAAQSHPLHPGIIALFV